jgi:hypothetical protein
LPHRAAGATKNMGKSEPVVAGNELFGEIVYKNTLKEVVVEASSKLFIYI